MSILVSEAAYFVCAVAYLTVFGFKVAHGESPHHGFLETSTLPIVAVGVFVVWALAITFVLDFNQGKVSSDLQSSENNTSGSKVGFCSVLFLHILIGVASCVNHRPVLGSAVLVLGCLLALCAFAHYRYASRTIAPSLSMEHV